MAQLGLSPGMVQAVMDGYRARMGVNQQEKARKDAMVQTFLGQLGGGLNQMNANKARQMSMDQAATQSQLDRDAQAERDKALFAQQTSLNNADNVTSWMNNRSDNRRMMDVETSRQTFDTNAAAAKQAEANAARARGASASRGIAGGMGVTLPDGIEDPSLARQMTEMALKRREQEQIGTQTAGLMRGFPGVPSVPLPFGPMAGTPAIPAMGPRPDVVARMAGASKSIHPDALKAAMGAAETAFPRAKPTPPPKPAEPGLAPELIAAILGGKQLPPGVDPTTAFGGLPASMATRVAGAIPDRPKPEDPKAPNIATFMSPNDAMAYKTLYGARERLMGDVMSKGATGLIEQIDAKIKEIVDRYPQLSQAMGGSPAPSPSGAPKWDEFK